MKLKVSFRVESHVVVVFTHSMQQIVAHPSVESPFLNDVTVERAKVNFSYIHRRRVKRFNQVPRYFFRTSFKSIILFYCCKR